MLAYYAKAVTGAVLAGLLLVIGDPNVTQELSDEVETIVGALLVGLGVGAAPFNNGTGSAKS